MKPEKQKFNWFDKICMYSALVMFVGGMGAFGYGAFRAIRDAMTQPRVINKNPDKLTMPADTVMFNPTSYVQKGSH